MQRSHLLFHVASFVTLSVLASACSDEISPGGDARTQTGTDDTIGAVEETGDGDGDPSPGDGDGDPSPGDGDGDGDGDGEGEGRDEAPGDGDGDGNPLDDIPPEQWEDTPNPDGVPSPLPGVYDDQGAADPSDGFRSLIGLSLRDRDALVDFVTEVSDPHSDIYGQWLTVPELLDAHAPLESDFELLQAWLEVEGFSVDYLASNRMLIQFGGTVGQFNEAFNTTLHVCMRKNPQQGNPPIPVYCAIEPMTLPLFVTGRSPGIITADLPAGVGQLPPELGDVISAAPNDALLGSRLTPDRVARAYGLAELYQMGYDGSGQRIGVIVGATLHLKWAQSFWQTWDIVRENPQVEYQVEPPITRYIEAQIDSTWAGAMAPGAELKLYSGHDARNTAMVFTFNEAITKAQGDGVSVLTDSFAHREDSEPKLVRDQYNDSALIAAALGLTVVAASGDSARPDTPSSSPYVTAVGGTRLWLDGTGEVVAETTWSESGSGVTKSFAMPPWQLAVASEIAEQRVVVDVSAAASPGSPYWVYYNGAWALWGGTSFSAPVWAGMLAVINQWREDNGMAPVGFFNHVLYDSEAVQATFHDVTEGGTDLFAAGPGWDAPTGWGTPNAAALASAIPSP